MLIDYVQTPEALENLCLKIKQVQWIALDTEFIREKTYYPQFCLLQIATPDWVACIDPLVLNDLTPLFNTIYNPDLLKVFHSSRQDLEIFYYLTGKTLTPIFDTQLAANLLGFPENSGYGALVTSLLSISLDKAHTRADWSERPLSHEKIQYAADDVIHLCKIYLILNQKLNELERLEWLKPDLEALENVALYEMNPENAWQKIKGKSKLKPKSFTILKALAQWREQTAQKANYPRNWIIRDDVLLDIARLQPRNLETLSSIRSINEGFIKRYGYVICDLVKNAKINPFPEAEEEIKFVKKTTQQEAVIDILCGLVRLRAEENLLNPATLASRSDLEKLLNKKTDCILLHGWRYAIVGQELCEFIEGKRILRMDNGTILSQIN